MVLRTDRWLRALAWVALALPASPCLAASLQVSPTQFELRPEQKAEALWISNSGTETVQVQVRVFQWQQADGRDQLTPTQALLPSPPMQALADDVAKRIAETFWRRYQMLRWPQVGLPVLGVRGQD